jgi:hypothetical protein
LRLLEYEKGEQTGITFIDPTKLVVCDNHRIHSHKVFEGLAQREKTSMGGRLKLHLIASDQRELLGVKVTPGNTDDREPVPEMAQELTGSIFGDKGYITQKLFEQLIQQGLRLVFKNQKKHEKVNDDRFGPSPYSQTCHY